MLHFLYLKAFFTCDLNRIPSELLGKFPSVSNIALSYWLASVLVLFMILCSKHTTLLRKKLLIDAILCLGASIFVLFILHGICTKINMDYFLEMNRIPRKLIYLETIGCFLFFRTSHLFLLISLCLFGRFSLLPYIEGKKKSSSQAHKS